MLWFMMLACAGGRNNEQDTGGDPERFVQLFAKHPASYSPAWCAQRADSTLSCFGTDHVLEGLDQDAQWLSVDLACGCGLDVDGEPRCWVDQHPAIAELAPGPYSQMGCDWNGEWAWAVREGTGELVVVERDWDWVATEAGIAVRDLSDPTRSMRCHLDWETGAVACQDGFYSVETSVTGADFQSVSLSSAEILGCAVDADGNAECFSPGGDPALVPELGPIPLLKKVVDTRALALDGELLELYPPLAERELLPLGERYVDYHVGPNYDWDVGIPVDAPKTVVAVPEAVETMDILPPGWE